MSSPGSPAGGGGGGASGRGAPTGAAPIPRRGGPGVLRGAPGVGAGAASSAPGPGIARGAAAAGSGSPGMRGGGGAGGVARGGAARGGGVGSPGSARPASEVGGAAAGGVPARGGGAGGVGGGMVRGGARGRASGLASSTGGIPTRPASERPPDRGALPARGPSADPAPHRPAGTAGPSGLKTSPSSSPGGVGVRATGSPSSVQRTPSSPSTSSSSSNAAASSAASSAAASPSGAAAQSSGAATSAGMARTYSNPLMNRPKGPGLRKSVMLRGGLRCVAQVSADAWVPFSATGVAIYPFEANGKYQISLALGDFVKIQEQIQDWYKGTILATGRCGIFPASYIKLEKQEENQDVIMTELVSCLREWTQLLQTVYIERRTNDFVNLKNRLKLLNDWFVTIRSEHTDEMVQGQLKSKVMEKIEETRRLLGLDVVVRRLDGDRATAENTPLLKLLDMHQEMSGNVASKKKNLNKKDMFKCDYVVFLEMKVLACSVGEPTETFFSLWRKDENRQITDEFQVTLTAQGMPYDVEKIGNIKTVFKDITQDDVDGELYLAVRLIRRGKLSDTKDSKPGKSKVDLRRPFGGGVLNITSFTEKEGEHSIAVYQANSESTFWNMREMITKNKDVNPVAKAKGVIVGVALYRGKYERVVEANPSLASIVVTEKYGFPEVLFPGVSRNDFYITLDSGEFNFERSNKSVELSVCVKNSMGETIPDCIFSGVGEPPMSEYRTFVLYHNNTPKWVEPIRLCLQPEYYPDCHLYFTAKQSSSSGTKEFANGFLSLTQQNGPVIADGQYTIAFFNKEKLGKPGEEASFYLTSDIKPFVRKGDSVVVSTLLCSTQLTQTDAMYSLLNWRKVPPESMQVVLDKFLFVTSFEIIKFLRETFDALFAISESSTHGSLSVYNAIVHVIGILVDERASVFTNFQPVLDAYLEHHFKVSKAHETLLNALFKQLQDISNVSRIISTFKACHYMLKFIISSWEQSMAQSGQPVELLKRDLHRLFQAITSIMRNDTPTLIGVQSVALKNFPSWLSVLDKVFTVKELSEIAANMINAVRPSGTDIDNKRKVISVEQMGVILAMVRGPLFVNKDSRNILTPLVIQQLRRHLAGSQPDVIKSCAEILSVLLDGLQAEWDEEQELLQSVISLLPEMMHAITFARANSDDRLLLMISTCFLSMVFQGDPNSILTAGGTLRVDSSEQQAYLLQFCELLLLLIRDCPYAKNWFALVMLFYGVLAKCLSIIVSHLMSKNPSSWDTNNQELCKRYFQAAFAFTTAPSLQLSSFSVSKQSQIRETYGDMRIDICLATNELLNTMQESHISLLSGLIVDLLRAAMIPLSEVRQLSIAVYHRLMLREYKQSGSFKVIESETIEAFSGAVEPDPKFNEYFFAGLTALLSGSQTDLPSCESFLENLKEFCGHLLALRDHGSHDDDRTAATLKLLQYLKEQNRMGAYVRYVHSLVDQHEQQQLPDRAAMILMLHCQLLGWDQSLQLEEQADCPAESEFDRKVRLYTQVISLYDKASWWERAIALVGELKDQHEKNKCDFLQVAEYLEMQASFYRKIATQERLCPEYFRVAYYGKGFPSNLRNREHIYCGLQLERLQDFVQRMQSKFPNANLLKSTDPPGDDIRESEEQYLQIFTVQAVHEDNPELVRLPAKVAEFLQIQNAKRFVYKRPFSKSKEKKKENEFLDLWTLNYFYSVKESFPLITARSEIVSTETVEVTPIENAVDTIVTKNKELMALSAEYGTGKHANASPFTMVLSGTIDACVAGGVDMYKRAFLTPQYLEENAAHAPFIEQLKKLLDEQLEVLNKSIVVHARICPPSMRQLQDHLEGKLQEVQDTFSGKAKAKAPTSAAPSPPMPQLSSQSSPSLSSMGSSSSWGSDSHDSAASGGGGTDSATSSPFIKRAPSAVSPGDGGAFVRARFAGRGRDTRSFLGSSRSLDSAESE